MTRLNKDKFDHELSFENFEKSSLDGILTRDQGSLYLNVEQNLLNLMNNPWESKLQVVLDLHLQYRF